jgi:lysine 6-dehydrogenase
MSFNYVVLGAGRQGLALAYDLVRHGEARCVTLIEQQADVAARGIARLIELLPEQRQQLAAVTADVADTAELGRHFAEADVVLSAVPYRFNAALTEAAVAAGASFCDLGGNTAVVKQQLALDAAARARGVSIVPDCGLAPGLGNILAAHGIAGCEQPEHVHVRCGGLPERPVGALGYKLIFNFDGLINEYSGNGEFLRDGQRVDVPALTELEEIEFPGTIGRCEAAVTSGGTSTCAETFRGRVQSYDYKTVRYPGHFAIVRALFELGCFANTIELPDGRSVAVRQVMRRVFETQLAFPDVRDLVVLRCTVLGRHGGRPFCRQYDLFDRHDAATGFTAMERTTAFPAALVAYCQARKLVAPGARPLETAIPLAQYMSELPRHDIRVTVHEE